MKHFHLVKTQHVLQHLFGQCSQWKCGYRLIKLVHFPCCLRNMLLTFQYTAFLAMRSPHIKLWHSIIC